jgi:hypothetical protein
LTGIFLSVNVVPALYRRKKMADFLKELRELCGYHRAFEEKKKKLANNITNDKFDNGEFIEVLFLHLKMIMRYAALNGNRTVQLRSDNFTEVLPAIDEQANEIIEFPAWTKAKIFISAVGAVEEKLRGLGFNLNSNLYLLCNNLQKLAEQEDWDVIYKLLENYRVWVMY